MDPPELRDNLAAMRPGGREDGGASGSAAPDPAPYLRPDGVAEKGGSMRPALASQRDGSLSQDGFVPRTDRNYLSKSWLETLALSERRLPHFEIGGGRLDFRGTVGVEAGLERTKSLNKQQRKLTRLFLREMDHMCRERGIPFVVLVLRPQQGRDSPRNDRLLRFLEASQIRHLDLRGVSDSYFPEDRHPTPDWHRAMARAIAEADPIGAGAGGRRLGEAQRKEAWSTKMGDDHALSSAGAVQSSSSDVRKSP